MTIRGALESSALLRGLPDRDIEGLAAHCIFHHCGRGEAIWLAGAGVPFCGLVASGFVRMVRSTSDGSEMTMEIMGPGQIFGLLGVLSGTGCPLMAYGFTKTSYLKIDKEAFLAVYREDHALKDRILLKTSARLHQKLDFMSKLSTGKAEVRVAAILMILADSFGSQNGTAISLNVPITRQEIGEMAGTTTETVIRVFSKLTKSGVLQTDQHIITICSLQALESILH